MKVFQEELAVIFLNRKLIWWYHKGIEEYARLSEISMMEGHCDMIGSYSPLCLAAEGQEFLPML